MKLVIGIVTLIALAAACTPGEKTYGLVRLAVATGLEPSASCVAATAGCAPMAITWGDGTLAVLLDNVNIHSGSFGNPVRIRITSVPSRSRAYVPTGTLRDVREGDIGWVPAGMLD